MLVDVGAKTEPLNRVLPPALKPQIGLVPALANSNLNPVVSYRDIFNCASRAPISRYIIVGNACA